MEKQREGHGVRCPSGSMSAPFVKQAASQPVRPRVNPDFSNTDAVLGIAALKAMPLQKGRHHEEEDL
jgi:hypothetical protein